ncbi:MAG: hypothetical protein IJ418_15520 [Clostridia bacterium]|nr:hypothetical protein [Clostridia bacterium]
MFFCEELARNSGVGTMMDAIKMLEEYHVNRDLNDGVVAALYCIAAHDASYIVPAHRREELIQISVVALTKDLPDLVEQKSDAKAFSHWMRYRLRTILNNQNKTSEKKDAKERAWTVEGNKPVAADSTYDLFSTLRAPLDTEQEIVIREFVDTLAGLVVEEALSYAVGFWGLLAGIHSPELDIASLFLAGEFISFKQLLLQEHVCSAHVDQLMSALEISWKTFMRDTKDYDQTKDRVKDYKWRVRKALIKHRDLHQYISIR